MIANADPRSPAVQQAAQAAFEDADGAAAAASAAVDEARVALALGQARPGDVVRAQRRLTVAIEDRENARASVRAVAREAQRLTDAAAAEREGVRIAAARQLSEERDDLARELGEFLANVSELAVDLDARARIWNGNASAVRKEGGVQPGHISVPSDLGRAWGAFTDGLAQLRREYPVRGTK
jgi:hypothetical protein